MDLRHYRARWVFPVESGPLEYAVLEIAGGRIVALHNRDVPSAIDLGNVALIPGLVNAHTHLEFSDLAQPLGPSRPFTHWIRSVVAHRRQRSGSTAAMIEHGLSKSVESGSTCMAEIATSDDIPDAPRPAAPRLIVFRELLALPPDRIDEQLEIAQRHLMNQKSEALSQQLGTPHSALRTPHSVLSALNSPPLRGLSPHAPYSVHPELFHRLIELARRHHAPVAMHLAETRAEIELLRDGTGDFVEMLREFGVWSENVIPRGTRPIDYLRELATLNRGLVVHGNYLDAEERAFVAEHPSLSVIYCPRTHSYFRHELHPWQELLEHGANVALGTDSRASNPDLSLWGELLFLRQRFPECDPAVLLRLGTLNGAKALGLDAEIGSLLPGKSADVVVVNLPERDDTDPYRLLFDPHSHVVGTMIRGDWLTGPLASWS